MDRIYFSGRVKRCHTTPLNQQDTCASHSWGVAKHLHFMHPNARKELILAGIFHDVVEIEIGDFIWPMKNRYPEIKRIDEAHSKVFIQDNIPLGNEIVSLTKEEVVLLGLADMLDFYDFCEFESSLGNTFLTKKKKIAREVLAKQLEQLIELESPLYESVMKYVSDQLSRTAATYAVD